MFEIGWTMSDWHTEDRPALGVWVKLALPEVLELLAATGIDYVVIDCEHGAIDRRTMSGLVGVARGLGLRAFVRVPDHSRAELQAALDADADGLFVPHVDDRATAARIVDQCRFPPHGSRAGSPATRAGGWGRLDRADYVSRGNAGVTIVAQLESAAAVDATAEIASVPGLDAVFVGPFDLALSSGLDSDSPELRDLVRRVERSPRRAALGGVATRPADVRSMGERGYGFLMIGADVSFFSGAVSAFLADTREPGASTPKESL